MTYAREAFVRAFATRCAVQGGPSAASPGLQGVLGDRVRLLVTDDAAAPALAGALERHGVIDVFDQAPDCAALLADHPAWQSHWTTAMVCRDLAAVPEVALALERKPVPDEVPLADAVAVAARADASVTAEQLAGYLATLPDAARLWAGVDHAGIVRATSGTVVYGDVADVLFINTDPDSQGKGIGTAMTAAALRAAHADGARMARLTASAAGRRLYERLGFEAAGRLLHCSRLARRGR